MQRRPKPGVLVTINGSRNSEGHKPKVSKKEKTQSLTSLYAHPIKGVKVIIPKSLIYAHGSNVSLFIFSISKGIFSGYCWFIIFVKWRFSSCAPKYKLF